MRVYHKIFEHATKYIDDLSILTLAKQFYTVLVNHLELRYGDVLLATATRSQLQALLNNDWPFLTNQTDVMKVCLNGSDCDRVEKNIEKLGDK